MGELLSTANWRGVFTHRTPDKKEIAPADWADWWMQTVSDLGLGVR